VPWNLSPSPTEPSRRTGTPTAAAEVKRSAVAVVLVPSVPNSPSFLSFALTGPPGRRPRSRRHAAEAATPSPASTRDSGRPHRCTSSTPPHRRHRAAGELRTVLLLLPVQYVSQMVPSSPELPSPVMPRRALPPAPLSAAGHRLARPFAFLLHPIKGHQDLLSTPRPSIPHLPHHSAAAAERRHHRPSPPLGHRLQCFPLPLDPWVSFPVSFSSSPCICFRIWRTGAFSQCCSGEPPSAGAAARRRLPIARRLRATGAVRWARTAQI
jgi:hypothetical protein